MAAIPALAPIAGMKLGLMGVEPMTPYLDPVALYWSAMVGNLFSAIKWTWIWTAFVLVLKLVLRKDALAWGALALIASLYALDFSLPLALRIPVMLAMGSLFAFNLWKGQICAVALVFTVWTLVGIPQAVGLDRWYAWRGYVAIAAVVGLAVAGFRIAIGKRALLPATGLD
jgi:hypothetical protein